MSSVHGVLILYLFVIVGALEPTSIYNAAIYRSIIGVS